MRLEPFDLLVGGLDPVALCCLTVVHDHGIQAKNHNGRTLFLQPPQKQPLQEAAKQENPRPPEAPEKPLHRMGGEHQPGFALNGPRVSFILLEGIEEDQVPACAVHEETQQLLKDLTDRLPFAVLAERAKQALKMGIQGYGPKVADKQSQAAAARQAVAGHLHRIDSVLVAQGFCGRIAHRYLPPNGLFPWSDMDLRKSFPTTG